MSLTVISITNRGQHDAVVSQSKQTPTVLHVSNSALPACKAFSPRYEQLAARHAADKITFAEMDFNTETSYLFKFSPNQLPVTVAMYGDRWATTVMGADMRALEDAISIMLEEVKRGNSA